MGWLLSLLGGGGLIAALVFIPGLWLKVQAGLKWLVDVICEHPREAIIVAALAWGTYERLDAIHARQTTVAWAAKYDAHMADDKRLADEEHRASKTSAKEADNVHTIIKTVYRDAAARYIADNTIRLPAAPAYAPAAGGAPGLPAPAPAETIMVAVKPDDITAASDTYAYALSEYLRAKAKVEAGRAVYADDDGVLPQPELGK